MKCAILAMLFLSCAHVQPPEATTRCGLRGPNVEQLQRAEDRFLRYFQFPLACERFFGFSVEPHSQDFTCPAGEWLEPPFGCIRGHYMPSIHTLRVYGQDYLHNGLTHELVHAATDDGRHCDRTGWIAVTLSTLTGQPEVQWHGCP